MIPPKIKFIKMKDVGLWETFRFRNKFWEFSSVKEIAWPRNGSVAERFVMNDWMKEQKVAVLKE